MDRLPEEIIINVISFLSVSDIVQLQSVSRRLLILGRDNATWKSECFSDSQAETFRRRQQLLSVQDSRLSDLRNAVAALPGADLTAWEVAQLRGSIQPRASADPGAEARRQKHRALANWEPGYPGERIDYYEEYIHRHGPVNVGWLTLPKAPGLDKEAQTGATGLGTLVDGDSGTTQSVVAPLDDGSICIWDISPRTTSKHGGGGRLMGQSRRGLLTGQTTTATPESHALMTETGAVECVTVDSLAHKAYFAVQSLLHECDLSTLQLTSTKRYPFPITALSEARDKIPVTVGTNFTVHLHDPRDPGANRVIAPTSTSGELIGGSVYSHATLEQPGPLSILHTPSFNVHDSSIWVAGRFTSILNYDRRFFPRLRGHIFSGARLANIACLPHPFTPRDLDLNRNPSVSLASRQHARTQAGLTLLAAGEYKGKGSLEFYGLSPTPQANPIPMYQNRQTASASKLLAVANHGGRVVISDGDGNLKWLERNGFMYVRSVSINDAPSDSSPQSHGSDAGSHGIWSSSANELPGQGDIVQKIVPTQSSSSSNLVGDDGRFDTNASNLLLWTGDGRLGFLGFGKRDPLAVSGGGAVDEWHDAVETQTTTEKAREDAARQYEGAMRRALERNADEVRFVRGLGMGFM